MLCKILIFYKLHIDLTGQTEKWRKNFKKQSGCEIHQIIIFKK